MKPRVKFYSDGGLIFDYKLRRRLKLNLNECYGSLWCLGVLGAWRYRMWCKL